MSETTRVAVFRFFFALIDPVDIPDGQSFTEAVGAVSSKHGDPTTDPVVTIVYHQVAVPAHDPSSQTLEVAAKLYPTLLDGLTRRRRRALKRGVGTAKRLTVVEAVIGVNTGGAVDPAVYNVALSACVRLTHDHVRAYRLASQHAVALPTLTTVRREVVAFVGCGERIVDGASVRVTTAREWTPFALGAGDAALAEPTFGPQHVGGLVDVQRASPEDRFAHWMREIRVGNPLLVWRDRMSEAVRASGSGDHVMTVLHCATAAETLLDGLLLMLLWEEQISPAVAADVFAEGGLFRRIQAEAAPRLGGRWSTEQPGPVKDWYCDVSRIRNRVVHGGYEPSDAEGTSAVAATFGMETFVFDALAQQRNRYPRTTLLTVAPAGLERRGLWSGRIRRFAESGPATTEPNWQTDFRRWRDEMEAART